MASIKKQKNGKYKVRWYKLDGVEGGGICPDLATAKELELEVESALALGRDCEPESVRAGADLETVIKSFLEHRALRLRGRTLHRYAENLQLFGRFVRQRRPKGLLLPSLLTKPLLEDYYAWLCRAENGLHGRAREPDTARKIAEVAQLMWMWAEDHLQTSSVAAPEGGQNYCREGVILTVA